MTHNPIILITGANGEVGHGLIEYFSSLAQSPEIITLDLQPLDEALIPLVSQHYVNNILDDTFLKMLYDRHTIGRIFHLAALLSTTGEKNPKLAHDVNVNGTQKLLDLAIRASEEQGNAVKFIFPSSIAVYGLPDLATKEDAGAIAEDDYLFPTTMYGNNKLYCENIGRYYARYYQQLAEERSVGIDFRALRFPGLISAHTIPSGGTSDYGPEMIHAAAQGKPYICFVRPDAALPFMVMPDGIRALIQLSEAPRAALTREVYNVTSFSLRASDFEQIVEAEFPNAEIRFKPHMGRQSIVDSWAGDIDDRVARADWGWSPEYDRDAAFADYLFPHIR
ncbi:MAG: NAD-dependent epimerase/dehydratase family protein, partial [Phototrophicaceae bacterium]